MGQVERRKTETERIAEAYLDRAGGNARAALRLAIRDALTDLAEAEGHVARADRRVSAGYVRAALSPVRGES